MSKLTPDAWPKQSHFARSHRGKSHRRMPGKTPRRDIVTRFGKITLFRARYRRGRAGRTLFPLELLLGIEDGFTLAAATRIGKQFATCGSSQGRTREMIADQMGAKIGTEKLRETEKKRKRGQVSLMYVFTYQRGLTPLNLSKEA
jgi:hypothetical protein